MFEPKKKFLGLSLLHAIKRGGLEGSGDIRGGERVNIFLLVLGQDVADLFNT